MITKRLPTIIIVAMIGLSASGCAQQPVEEMMLVQSDVERATSPQVEKVELQKLVNGNSAFAFALYQALCEEEGNLFFSPYSISLALAMTYAGARGETEREMAETLHILLHQDRLHPAFNALDLELASRGEDVEKQDGDIFRLNITNSIWGQYGYNFIPEFLDILAENYGAGLRLLDFAADPEAARQIINEWVSDQTEEKIKDLIPQGAIDALTRLVLANAIYFNAGWLHPFDEDQTREGAFHLLEGGQVNVPLMSQTETFQYAEGTDYQAVVLPYVGGDMAMAILLPVLGQFRAFESSLGSEMVTEIMQSLEMRNITLTMPKFTYESSFKLNPALAEMGMTSAFGDADFSGMDGTRELFISYVLHKAFVSVDEEGTEAAAATAVIMGKGMAAPPIEMVIDRPFIYVILDLQTGTILFIGRVLNPTG